MVEPKPAAPEARTEYKVRLRLSDAAWDKLAARAKETNRLGHEEIEEILETWAAYEPDAPAHPRSARPKRLVDMVWEDNTPPEPND